MSRRKFISPWVIAAGVFVLLTIPTLAVAQNYTDLSGPWQPRNEADIAVAGTTLYVADQAMLFKSTDGGTTWAPSTNPIASPRAVVAEWNNPSIVAVGVTGYIYSSTDGGTTWTSALADQNLTPIRLSSSPLVSANVYLGRQYVNGSISFWYSSNGGASWSARSNFTYGTSVNDVAPYYISGSGNDNTVYAVGSDGTLEYSNQQDPAVTRGVWRSPDLGLTWYQSYMGDFNVKAIAVRDLGLGNYPHLVVGTVTGKVSHSTDNGQTWSTPVVLATGVSSITAIHYGGNPPQFYAATNKGVYASTDDGNTWTGPIGSGMTDKNVLSMSMVVDDPNTIYAGTIGAFYKSGNSGANWSESDNQLGRMPLSSVTSDQTTAWTVSENFPYISKYSANWSRTQLGSGGFSGEQVKRDIYATGDKLYITGAVNGVATYFRSTDGGSTFSSPYQPSTNTGTIFYGTVVDPFNPSYVYLFGYAKDGSGNIRNWLRSVDGGATWQATWNPIGGSNPVRDMVVDKLGASGYSQKLLAAIQNGGVVRSTDGGGSWSQVLSASYDMRSFAMNPNNPQTVYATGYSSGVAATWKSTDEGATWNVAFGGYRKVVMCPGFGTNDVTHIAAISANGSKVWYSADGGANWLDETFNLPASVNDLYGDASSQKMYVATGSGAFVVNGPSGTVTTNAPTNPSTFDVGLSWSSLPQNAVAFHLQISYHSTGSLLTDAPAFMSTSYSPMNLINSTQYDWKVAANNIAGETNFATGTSFTINASQSITLSCGTNSSCNPVLSWTTDVGTAVYKIYRYSCPYTGAAPISPSRPACNCGGGTDCSPHPETSPYPLLATTQATSYTDVGVTVGGSNPNTAYFYEVRRAGYSNKASALSGTAPQPKIAVAHGTEKPAQTQLEANYPNPFNPVTQIRYSLASDTYVTLKVYDVLGREVALLADEYEQAGFKSVDFNAGSLPSGVYFYRLEAGSANGGFTAVKKMILAK